MNSLALKCIGCAGVAAILAIATAVNAHEPAKGIDQQLAATEQTHEHPSPGFARTDLRTGMKWVCNTTIPRAHADGDGHGTKGHIEMATKWPVFQAMRPCFPEIGEGTVFVPYRIVDANFSFDLDGDGNPIDLDYTAPDDDADPPYPGFPLESMKFEEQAEVNLILEAMTVIERACNIRFAPRNPNAILTAGCFPTGDPMSFPPTPPQPWILIVKSTDDQGVPPPTWGGHSPSWQGNTSSSVGVIDVAGGDLPPQYINLESMSLDTIVHELLHAIGFYHEHQRLDRDTYVEILEEHIFPFDLDQFMISDDPIALHGEYDFRSVMHYGTYAFSIWPGTLPTILVQPGYESFQNQLGAGIGDPNNPLSTGDIAALVDMYGENPDFIDPCLSDFDGSGSLDSGDVLLFIIYFANQDPRADINNDGVINGDDILLLMDQISQGGECSRKYIGNISNSSFYGIGN